MPRVIEFEPSMIEWVGTNEALSLLIDGRIYPDHLPQREMGEILPACIVHHCITATHWNHFRGACNVQMNRLQLDCYGSTADIAKTLGRTVADEFNRFVRGQMANVFVQHIRAEDSYDDSKRPIDPRETMDYCRRVDVIVYFQEDSE